MIICVILCMHCSPSSWLGSIGEGSMVEPRSDREEQFLHCGKTTSDQAFGAIAWGGPFSENVRLLSDLQCIVPDFCGKERAWED